MPTMNPAPLSHPSILAALTGQTLTVPDLTAVFPATTWPPSRTHTRAASLVSLIDAAIDRMAVAHPVLARRKRDDIAGLVSRVYPSARDEAIEPLALFVAWLVCWDDAVDAAEGDLAADFERGEEWRETTLRMIRAALRVDDDGDDAAAETVEAEADPVHDPVNAVLQEFAQHFTPSTPPAQRRRVYAELHRFVSECGVEQRLRLDRVVPDYGSYMSLRVGTVGGGLLCSLVEYAAGEALPEHVATPTPPPQLRELGTQASVLLAILNDVLSLKKELHTGCVINAVATLMAPGRGLDDVVRELKGRMDEAVAAFDRAAGEMEALVQGDEVSSGVVRRHVDACRATVVGTLEFT